MKNFLFLIILLSSTYSYSQGEANNWYFGESAGIKFDGSSDPINISNSAIKISTNEGCSTFSDSNGDLLFYSDGRTVWNKNHSIMTNGTNLLGNSSSTQSAMIIPKPESSNLYYLFTVGSVFNGSTPGFNYYTIDINQSNGLGSVIAGPIDLADGKGEDWTEKVAAVKGAECNTYWILSLVKDTFYAYKITKDGVEASPVISPITSATDIRGYLKVSPDGKKVVLAHYIFMGNEPGGDSAIYLYDFDDATGKVSDETRIFDDPFNENHPYGLEFSRQSTKLYSTTFDGTWNYTYQYDIESTNIKATETLIHTQRGYRGALQIGPNGKIYATVPVDYYTGINNLNVINNPEAEAIDCNYEQNAINLGTGIATQGLPPFIASLFSPIELTTNNADGDPEIINGLNLDLCIGETITIVSDPLSNTATTITYEWTYNGTVIADTPGLILTNIDTSHIGDYKLEVKLKDECERATFLDGFFTINSVNEIPVANPIDESLIICDTDYSGTFEFDLDTDITPLILGGQLAIDFEVHYFKSQEDADKNDNEFLTPYTSENATLYARIQSVNNSECYDTTSFTVEVYEEAQPAESINIPDLSFCDDDSFGTDIDGIVLFDLTQRESDILNGQSIADFDITYFTNSSFNVSSIINDPKIYSNTTPTETIYIQAINKLHPECIAETSFKIEVFKLPTINSAITFKNCDADGVPDGFTDYNLNEVDELITNDTDIAITYHLNMPDATSGTGAITTTFNNNTQNIIYARIENSNLCFQISTVTLDISITSFPNDFEGLKLETCDDDTDIYDGFHTFNLTDRSQEFIAAIPSIPTAQNLSVHYYRGPTDALLELNEILTPEAYTNEVPFEQKLFVRMETESGECSGIGELLTLTVHPTPQFEVEPTSIYCTNLPPITLDVLNPEKDNYTYEWTFNNILISDQQTALASSEGIYTVTATSIYGCTSLPQIITVSESSNASITQDNITIIADLINNTVTIDTTNIGIGEYEFSIDSEFSSYQDDPFFEELTPGEHILYIQDKNNCGITSIEISIIGFPKFFTPNDDGYNDTWQIEGFTNDYQASLIYIYDRYGKPIAKIDPEGEGWNGYFNGTEAIATDYWFYIELTNKDGITTIKKGHFSLIRR